MCQAKTLDALSTCAQLSPTGSSDDAMKLLKQMSVDQVWALAEAGKRAGEGANDAMFLAIRGYSAKQVEKMHKVLPFLRELYEKHQRNPQRARSMKEGIDGTAMMTKLLKWHVPLNVDAQDKLTINAMQAKLDRMESIAIEAELFGWVCYCLKMQQERGYSVKVLVNFL